MTLVRKLVLLAAAVITCAALPDSAAHAAGTGGVDVPRMPQARERSPAELAKAAHNSGVRNLRRAQELDEAAAQAKDEGRKEKSRKKAAAAYEKALKQFETAVSHDPSMAEAWNYLGYSQRHLGQYESALQSYAQALKLEPGFPEAIEYRGEAFLGLNRLDDAREAYLQLFASARPLADRLLTSMQRYVEERRSAPNGLDPAALESFASWVSERAAIAQQTASLDPARSAGDWR